MAERTSLASLFGERSHFKEFIPAANRIHTQQHEHIILNQFNSNQTITRFDEYYPDNSTDSEEISTPDAFTERNFMPPIHSRTQQQILSRLSSSESLSEYSPQYPPNSQISNRMESIRSSGHAGSVVPSPQQAVITPPAAKCRQLPCRTFISTGSCPYGDRCVFLHDACIVSRPVFIKVKVREHMYCSYAC